MRDNFKSHSYAQAELDHMTAEELVQFNPLLKDYTPQTRIAYAKFKSLGEMAKLKEETRCKTGIAGTEKIFRPKLKSSPVRTSSTDKLIGLLKKASSTEKSIVGENVINNNDQSTTKTDQTFSSDAILAKEQSSPEVNNIQVHEEEEEEEEEAEEAGQKVTEEEERCDLIQPTGEPRSPPMVMFQHVATASEREVQLQTTSEEDSKRRKPRHHSPANNASGISPLDPPPVYSSREPEQSPQAEVAEGEKAGSVDTYPCVGDDVFNDNTLLVATSAEKTVLSPLPSPLKPPRGTGKVNKSGWI